MALDKYRRKRDFGITPEPRGGRVAKGRGRPLAFVIQKHAASHLHYDFRLELDGVLLSWAVPKGPSLDPADKRLAMHVEDHPLEYGGFEGIIPEKQYGGGTVLLWDRGTWTPQGDPRAAYAKGHLKFELNGAKLHGHWDLVRTGGGKYGGNGKQAWLLIKEKDAFAQSNGAAPIVVSEPDSVATGRDLDDIAKARKNVWASNRSVKDNVKAGAVKLAASTKASAEVTVAGVKLSHPDKLYFPEAEITKRDIAEYYEFVAQWLLPHMVKRPLSLVRCPDGWSGQCFYQKHADRAVNAAVARIEVPEDRGTATYMGASNVKALASLVQWGVIEMHPWGSRQPRLDRPDQLIFDFDPDEGHDWKSLKTAATLLRTLLEEIDLTSFIKTTGGKGLHVVVPIRPTLSWDDAKGFTRAVAEHMVATFPDRFTATVSKAKRKQKIFVDYLRNAKGATAVAPYSVRARKNAPVATPIFWEELAKDIRFDHFNVSNIRDRLAKDRDPWADFTSTKQTVTKLAAERVGYRLSR